VSGACVATCPPFDRPPSLHRLRHRCHSALFEASQVLCSRPTPHPRACPSFGCCLHGPVRRVDRTRTRSPRFPYKGRLHVQGSPTARGSSSASRLRGEDVAFSSAERDRHLGIRPVSQLNTRSVVFPCERFKLSLAARPCITRGRGGWLRHYPAGRLAPPSFASFPGALRWGIPAGSAVIGA